MYKVKFFNNAGRDMVELSIVGDPNTVIRKVQDVDRTKFPKEWEAYSNGSGSVQWGGTPLTELVADPDSGAKVAAGFATSLAAKGVQNVEMLAALSDQAAMSLGMGVVTLRTRARAHLGQVETSAIAALVGQSKQAPADEPVPLFDDADIAPVEDDTQADFAEEPEPAPAPRRRKAAS